MYVPSAFAEDDRSRLHALMRAHPLATLITWVDGVPTVTHLPLLLVPDQGEHGTLLGHLAYTNPQSRHLDGSAQALCIFQGPHSYISPTWYTGEFNVPTWNFTAVHAYGCPQPVTDDEAVRALLDAQTASFEARLPTPWSIPWNDGRNQRMLAGITAFEMEISRMEGKFKLNQNKSAPDRQRVIEMLSASSRETARDVARMMAENEQQSKA